MEARCRRSFDEPLPSCVTLHETIPGAETNPKFVPMTDVTLQTVMIGHFTSLLNTPEGGTIFLGTNVDGHVEGIRFKNNTERDAFKRKLEYIAYAYNQISRRGEFIYYVDFIPVRKTPESAPMPDLAIVAVIVRHDRSSPMFCLNKPPGKPLPQFPASLARDQSSELRTPESTVSGGLYDPYTSAREDLTQRRLGTVPVSSCSGYPGYPGYSGYSGYPGYPGYSGYSGYPGCSDYSASKEYELFAKLHQVKRSVFKLSNEISYYEQKMK